MKLCKDCNMISTDFSPSKYLKDGLSTYCRPCKRLRDKNFDTIRRAKTKANNKTKCAVKSCQTCNWYTEGTCSVVSPGKTLPVDLLDCCLKFERLKLNEINTNSGGNLGSIYTDGIDFSETIGGYDL